MSIQYLTYQQINKVKWDACIDKADNGVVYAYSFYLDCMAVNWDALVISSGNEYEMVMPLTWNKKYGIYYLYQPPFTACLGVFGKQVTALQLQNFLDAIPKKFRYWDIYLNPGNYFQLSSFDLYQRMNFVLPLHESYAEIFSGYRENIQRNIKKSHQLQIAIRQNINAGEVISLANEQLQHFSKITAATMLNFESLFSMLSKSGKAITYGVHNAAGQLMASAIFFFSHKRAYYILPGNSPDGKTLGASHALIDAFIKDHAQRDLLLDFEGSDISSLAFFYSSFGAIEEKYPGLRINRLPPLLKWLKN